MAAASGLVQAMSNIAWRRYTTSLRGLQAGSLACTNTEQFADSSCSAQLYISAGSEHQLQEQPDRIHACNCGAHCTVSQHCACSPSPNMHAPALPGWRAVLLSSRLPQSCSHHQIGSAHYYNTASTSSSASCFGASRFGGHHTSSSSSVHGNTTRDFHTSSSCSSSRGSDISSVHTSDSINIARSMQRMQDLSAEDEEELIGMLQFYTGCSAASAAKKLRSWATLDAAVAGEEDEVAVVASDGAFHVLASSVDASSAAVRASLTSMECAGADSTTTFVHCNSGGNSSVSSSRYIGVALHAALPLAEQLQAWMKLLWREGFTREQVDAMSSSAGFASVLLQGLDPIAHRERGLHAAAASVMSHASTSSSSLTPEQTWRSLFGALQKQAGMSAAEVRHFVAAHPAYLSLSASALSGKLVLRQAQEQSQAILLPWPMRMLAALQHMKRSCPHQAME